MALSAAEGNEHGFSPWYTWSGWTHMLLWYPAVPSRNIVPGLLVEGTEGYAKSEYPSPQSTALSNVGETLGSAVEDILPSAFWLIDIADMRQPLPHPHEAHRSGYGEGTSCHCPHPS